MSRTQLQFLDDIIDAIHNIEEDTEGLTFHNFNRDRRRKDAVIRNFEIVGEATKNISVHLKERYPMVPWRRIAGLRDVVAHGYFQIDYEIIWDVIINTLPDYKVFIVKIRDDEIQREKEARERKKEIRDSFPI
ncbi:MAG: DUF86 domain-containing protein [Methanospirillaceae archaeon]|nr:DUF86 domain-containing protein [Methanospirillaceae archaeon]